MTQVLCVYMSHSSEKINESHERIEIQITEATYLFG